MICTRCMPVLPPQAARDPEYYERQNLPIPSLQVVREEDDGIVISGMKMLATGGVLANEIWIGNLIPLASSQTKQAVTCAVPVNIPGLTLWSRQPLELNAANEFDSPLSWRFDETDSMVMCEDVKVPWERVFVMDDPGPFTQHLHPNAVALLRKPPVQRTLLVEAQVNHRSGEPGR